MNRHRLVAACAGSALIAGLALQAAWVAGAAPAPTTPNHLLYRLDGSRTSFDIEIVQDVAPLDNGTLALLEPVTPRIVSGRWRAGGPPLRVRWVAPPSLGRSRRRRR